MKNLLLFSAFLFSAPLCFGQLFVRPNPNNNAADSYIYVKDQILFVEQDVNLAINNPGNTEASIYLREGSQLIQGATGSANSGTGHLSVYQNAPESDQWTYNYWGSPVGVATGAAGNTNFGMYRLYEINDDTSSDQTLRTTGQNGFTTLSPKTLNISSRWLYTHPSGGEQESAYIRFNASDAVTPGLGFTMKGVDPDPVQDTGYEYDFRGRPHNGTINVPVFLDEPSNPNITLVGNPYPSAIDLNRFYWDTDNTEILSIHFWDEDKDVNSHYYSAYLGGYGTWIPGAADYNGTPGDVGYNAGTYTRAVFVNYNAAGDDFPLGGGNDPLGDTYERRISPIGQGFLIRADATGTITFKNSHRRYLKEGQYSVFAKPENSESENENAGNPGENFGPLITTSSIDSRMPQIRIYTLFGESTHFRDMVLAFSDLSTDFFDRGFDAPHPNDSGNTDAYFPIPMGINSELKSCVIQTVPFAADKRIPIAFKLGATTTFKVKVVEQVNLPGAHAYLFDSENNTYRIITDGQHAEVTLPAGHYNTRFFIVFGNRPQLSAAGDWLKGEDLPSVDFFQNNPAQQLEINNPAAHEIKSASVYDMSGKLVIFENNLGNNSKYTFYTGNLANGIYLVKLITKDDLNIDYKAVVNNK